MDIEILENKFKQVEHSNNISEFFKFKELLLSSNEPEIIEYHFRLLERCKNGQLQEILARFFKARGEVGKSYLLEKINWRLGECKTKNDYSFNKLWN